MRDHDELLAAYDEQLRGEAETPSAVAVTDLGPLRLVTFPGGHGFVSSRHLTPADGDVAAELVGAVRDHFAHRTEVTDVEWKTRGHDHAPGLDAALRAHGFEPQEPEAVMMGDVAALAEDRQPPPGVTLRRIHSEADVRAMAAMADEAFGDPVSTRQADALLHRLGLEVDDEDAMELWVAEHDGVVVGAGRLEPVAGTEVAGVWGGSVLHAWRGRGIYRALTAARARSAQRLGKRLLHSDSTPMSQPILERSGMVAVTTTTPYEWRR